MASSRSKNTPGNYCLEQRAFQHGVDYCVDRDYAYVPRTLVAGDGLLQGRMGCDVLSKNPRDVESFLFGIGATNLVTPSTQPFSAHIVENSAMSIVDQRVPLIMPKDLSVQNDQRQYPMHSSTLVIR